MDEMYKTDELQLKQVKLLLVNNMITVQVNNGTVEYENHYAAFRFNSDTNEMSAPHFRLKVSSEDAQLLEQWLMDMFI